jgi:sulfate permease, SulP family
VARTRYQHTDPPPPVHELPAAALRAVLREGYGAHDLRADVLAGIVVGVVALPLAMALAIAVGVAPQRGLYTAIVGGFFVALLGGSRSQVSGPTAAFIVVLAPLYAKFGLSGLLMATLLGGLGLIALALMRLGKLIVYIPHPVTTGFTAGIATVIGTLQLKDLLGLQLTGNPQHFFERLSAMYTARHTLSWSEVAIGATTLFLLVTLPRVTRRVPAPIVALPLVALLAWLVAQLLPGFHFATIASRFSSDVGGHLVHGIPRSLPMPLWPWAPPSDAGTQPAFDFAMLRELIPGAFAVAMLGAIESLLSAVVADGMAGTKHDPDAELLALGVGNVLCAFVGGIPATGAIARTATNVRSGGRSPISAMVHALTILLAVLALAPWIGQLPMASLAALLVIVAWNMSEVRHFGHTLKVAPKSDVAVLVTCYLLTVAVDMVTSVAVGIVLAALLFMRRMVDVTHGALNEGGPAHLPLSSPPPPGVFVYDIRGPLFFGAAQKAMGALGSIAERAKVVVLRMDLVPVMDATGLVALESAVARLSARGCQTIICGLQPQPSQLLRRSAAVRGSHVIFSDDTPQALRAAEALLNATTPAHAPAGGVEHS